MTALLLVLVGPVMFGGGLVSRMLWDLGHRLLALACLALTVVVGTVLLVVAS